MDSNNLGFGNHINKQKHSSPHFKGIELYTRKGSAHLDIKSENIMIDTKNCTFKIIDFGFCSCEPFDEFAADPRGTPGYFPKYYARIE